MAETNKVVIDVDVKGGKSIQDTSMSLKELKQQLKEAQSQALNGDGKAAKRVAELKDKMEDLRDTTKSLQGSGVEKVTSSFGLLGEGLRNFDFDKIKTGFKGIGTAMSAIPIFLVAEGISYLIENWKELSEGNGVLAKSLQGISWLFTKLTEEITALTDALGLSNSALDKQGESIKTNAEKGAEALSLQNAEFDRQIAVAKASGKSTIEIEKAKQQAIIDTNLAVARQIEAFVRAGGEFDEEKRKLLTASLEAIKGAKVQEYVIEQEHTKKLNEEYKKRSDENKKKNEEIARQADDLFAQLSAKQDQEDARQTAQKEKEKADRAKHLEDLKGLQLKADQEETASKIAMWEEEDRQRKRAEEEENALNNARIQGAMNVAQTLTSLSDLVFTIRNSNLVKGSAEEERIARRQFQVNKALQIANASLSGTQAVMNALAAPNVIPEPGASIFRGIQIGAIVASTAASIAKISATQFGSTGGGGSVSSPNVSGSIGNSTPSTQTQAPSTAVQPFTRLDESGRNTTMQPVKAYVVESDMTSSQRRVGKLEGQASFG